LRFPLAEDAALPSVPPPWPGVIRGGDERILVVEDEEAIRRSAKRALEQLGYTVLLAEDGLAALAMLRAGVRIDLIVSDSVMPNLGGAELYERVREAGFRVPFLLASGYSPQEAALGVAYRPEVPFLPKPWTLNELTRKVRELLDSGGPQGPRPTDGGSGVV
jgi:CheY-like chemotaxis protein